MSPAAPPVDAFVRTPIRYNALGHGLLTILGAPQAWSYLESDAGDVVVHLGWMFRTRFARSAIESVEPFGRATVSLGVHGWRGRWLVNGAWSPLAVVTLREPVRAWVTGVPVKLRQLIVSVDDVDALRAELLAPSAL